MMRRLWPLLVLVACQKAGPTSVPEPADLIMTVSASSPKAVMARAAAYADAVSPGSGASIEPDSLLQMLRLAAGAPSLDGIDLDKPFFVLVLDPKKHPQPIVLVATVADEAKVKAVTGAAVKLDGGRVAVGEKAALDVAGAYALSLKQAPDAPTLRLSPGKLVALYRPEIDRFRQEIAKALSGAQGSPAMASIVEWEIDLLFQLADQADELRLVVDASSSEASLEMVLVPKAGTGLAKFVAAQKPGVDLSLLGELPTVEKPGMLMVGKNQLGPARDFLLEAVGKMIAAASGKPFDRARWSAFFDLFDGTMAMVSWQSPSGAMQLHEIFGVSDGAKAAATARELFNFDGSHPIDVAGMKMAWQTRPSVATHAGVAIDEHTIKLDMTAFPEAQREMFKRIYGEEGMRFYAAGSGKRYMATFGPEGQALLEHALDGTAKFSPSPAAAAALAAAAKREASLAIFFDVGQSISQVLGRPLPASQSGIAAEAIFTGGAARLRFGVPSAHVKEIMAALWGR